MDTANDVIIPIPPSANPRVVIIGGGFAGLKLAKKLVRQKFQVVLIDKHNYHTFQPLLYQVATAGLEPDSIAGPLRMSMAGNKDFYFRMAKVENILPEQNLIQTAIGKLSYDYLVIASGSTTNFFGNESIANNAFPLKAIPDALNLRSHILQNFEQAVITDDTEDLERRMNFVIVGGGPTGVEVAGALGELKRHVLPKDYPELDFKQMKIYLVEGNKRLLPGMSPESGENAKTSLKKFSVRVILEKFVDSFDGHKVALNDGRQIETNTVVWAAGVKGCLLDGISESSVVGGRLKVNHFNQVAGYDKIFAIGDIAIMETPDYPNGHPMVAPAAIQQGTHLAMNLRNLQIGKELKPFVYTDKGSMATIGRNRAVVDFPGKLRLKGLIAWFVWMFIHLIQIIGFRSKLVVFSNWVWNYLTYDRGTRLIIRPFVPRWEKDKKSQNV